MYKTQLSTRSDSCPKSRRISQEIIGISDLPQVAGGIRARVRNRRELKANFVGSASSESQLLLPCYHFGVSRCNHKTRTGWDLNPRSYFLLQND
jgi:hypothetical protein